MDNTVADMEAQALDALVYSAKIDYITLQTPRKLTLPTLVGKAKWSPKNHYRRLTIHDAQHSDLLALGVLYGPMPLLEMEVAVDIRSATALSHNGRQILFEHLLVGQFAKQLEPSTGAGMGGNARTFYRRIGAWGKVAPFNKRLPLPTDQQLHGWRHDDAQVKTYWKRVDQGDELKPSKHVARVEVRLGLGGLSLHGVTTTADLQHFRFRKRLMPYFRHVRGVRPPKSKNASPMLKLLRGKSSEIDDQHFGAVGVGAFVQGGARSHRNVLQVRNTQINNRIGQALTRLERQFSIKKRVP